MFPPGPIVPSGKLSERAEILKKKIKNVGLGSSPGSSKEVQKAQEELNDLRQKKKDVNRMMKSIIKSAIYGVNGVSRRAVWNDHVKLTK